MKILVSMTALKIKCTALIMKIYSVLATGNNKYSYLAIINKSPMTPQNRWSHISSEPAACAEVTATKEWVE